MVRRPGAALRPAGVTMQLWAGKKRSRYEDDGSRLKGTTMPPVLRALQVRLGQRWERAGWNSGLALVLRACLPVA